VSAEQHRQRLSQFLAAEWRQLVRTVRSWREFWEQEGREAFDRFIQRRQAPGQEKPEGPADTQG